MRQPPTSTPSLVDATNPRPILRRSLLTGAARTVGVGTLAVALAGGDAAGAVASPSASPNFADDLDLLTYLQTVERMAQALYQSALDHFAVDETNENRPLPYYPTLRRMLDQERSHLAWLSEAIAARGGVPATPEPAFDFGYDDFAGFIRTAAEAEDAAIAAYVASIPALADPQLRAAASGIVATEGRHAAYLRLRLGEQPFPAAIEQGRTTAEISAFVGRFVVLERSS